MSDTEQSISEVAASPKIVRYAELKPCFDAFIDTRSPGSDKKENFTIIGPGVSENPNQYVHIAEPHGFNIGGARQPPGCTNSQHSHDTEEVFFVHTGTWSFNLGEDGTDAKITLRPGDHISIPTKVFRGFENIGDDMGYLWAILGKDNPGRVLWAPRVFDMAKQYGLVLLESGLLIDTVSGETVPDGANVMPVTDEAQIAKLSVFDEVALRNCCVFGSDLAGTDVRSVIGELGPLSWPHGFKSDDIILEYGQDIGPYNSDKPDVVFVHKGALSVEIGTNIWTLEPGDTASIPKGTARLYKNAGDEPCRFIRVQGL